MPHIIKSFVAASVFICNAAALSCISNGGSVPMAAVLSPQAITGVVVRKDYNTKKDTLATATIGIRITIRKE